jgi:hypothetical protein
VSFENVFDDSIRVAEEVGLSRVRSLDLFFEGERSGARRLLAET